MQQYDIHIRMIVYNFYKYNVDEIQQRILNGDGGSWIKEPYDPDVIFQLDRYVALLDAATTASRKVFR